MAARALLIDADGNTMKQVSQINLAEDTALQGLTLAAQLIYLRGLRRYVNYSTGICGGHDIRLSWQRFSVLLEVLPAAQANNKAKQCKPSREFIRQRIKELEKSGLIVKQKPIKYVREYVFFLPLAFTESIPSLYEQPIKQPYEQPLAVHGVLSTEQCGLQTTEQPIKQPYEQPQNSATNTATVLEFTGGGTNSAAQQQPIKNTHEQPMAAHADFSTEQCSLQPHEQPNKTPDEQPYIYRKKEEENFSNLNDEQKTRAARLLKALASDGRLHSLDKNYHQGKFKDLVLNEKLSLEELREILKLITDNKFSIFLVANQIQYVRKAKRPHQNKAPVKAAPEPKQQQSIRANEIHDELSNLDQMLKFNPDDQKLKAHKLKLTSELERLNQAS